MRFFNRREPLEMQQKTQLQPLPGKKCSASTITNVECGSIVRKLKQNNLDVLQTKYLKLLLINSHTDVNERSNVPSITFGSKSTTVTINLEELKVFN